MFGCLWWTPEHLPAGRAQAGDRHLKFHKTGDNLAQASLVVAFGDSVAAGEGNLVPSGLTTCTGTLCCEKAYPVPYCGYDDGVWTDSPDAYSSVLASDLGSSVDNFAISGACAATGLPNCGSGKPTVESELAQAKPMNLDPSLVTLTVGADDINFEGCFESLVSITPTTPCSDTPSDLSTIEANVKKLLVQITAMYPGVPIALSLYYDPLPTNFTSETNQESPCSQEAVIYALHQGIQQNDWLEAVKTLITGNVGSGGKKYFDTLFTDVASIESALNSTLQSAVTKAANAGVKVESVLLSFAGHDFCQDYSGGSAGWVFGPSIHFSAENALGSLTATYVATDTCTVPDAGCKTVSGKGSKLTFDYKYAIGINDFPHPTVAGQEEIAQTIVSKLGL